MGERQQQSKGIVSLDNLIKQDNREGIVNYLMKDVDEIADKYTSDMPPGIEKEDLISAGYEALVRSVMEPPKLRVSTFEIGCRNAIEKGVQNYVLAEIADRTNVDYDSNQLEQIKVEPARASESGINPSYARGILVETIRALPERQREVMTLNYGLENGTRPMKRKDIAALLDVTPQAVALILNSALRKMKENKRTAAVLRDSLEYYKDLSADRETSSLPQVREGLREDLESARARFEEKFGGLLRFKMHFGFSRNEMAGYLSRLYPRLAPRSSLRVVELTEEEKARFDKSEMSAVEKYRDIPTIKRTIAALEKGDQPIKVGDKEMIAEAIRELYVPLFAIEPEKCITRLELESTLPENAPALRVLYKDAHTYFSQVKGMKIPGIKSELDDFQKVDVQILAGRKSSIIASDMGVGKSLEAIAHSVNKGLERILIATTKSGAVSTWPRELRKHLEGDHNVIKLTSQILREEEIPVREDVPNWFVATHAAATRYTDRIRRLGLDMIVIDESHRINNTETQQSAALTSLNAPHKLAISGGIFKNKRSELFPLLNWLFPTEFPDPDEFYRTYCSRSEGVFKLQYELRKKMILRFKDQVLRLPKLEHVHETVHMNNAQKAQYAAMEADFVKWYEENAEGIPPGLMNGTIFMKMHKIRNAAIAPKVPLIEELVEQSVESGRKAVVYTTYLPAVEQFRKKLGKFGVCHITGRSNSLERAQQIEQFDNDPDKKIFIITTAGGESIDLTSASDFIYANKPLTYADEKQALDRINRRGQRRNMRAFHITTENTVDERINAINTRKKEEYERVVHGSALFANWFEENEVENIRELLNSMIRSPEPARVV